MFVEWNDGVVIAATSPSSASRGGLAPGLDAITSTDIRRDLFAMGGDAMRGREAGTLDEMRATGWVAERAREAGLQPAGDDGTFFQWWPMRRTRLSESSIISVGRQDAAPVEGRRRAEQSIRGHQAADRVRRRQRGAGHDRRARQGGGDGIAVR